MQLDLVRALALAGACWLGAAGTALAAGNETLDLDTGEAATAVGADAAAAAQQPAEPATIDGFRSARFGMTADEVRAAIEADFGVTADQVEAGENALEKTTNLRIAVPGLMPEGGTARVVYIFGYESHSLIQVNIVWGAAEDSTPDGIRNAASLLVGYFRGQGYDPEKTAVGVPLEGGNLLAFYAEDADGSSVTLSIAQRQGEAAAEGEAAPEAALVMQLAYIADFANPDVFKLAPGSF
ncbi:MAG: hypothetical protein R3F55_20290 [Alphaproteobacteria bacterium]